MSKDLDWLTGMIALPKPSGDRRFVANRNVRLQGRSWVYFAQRGAGGPIKIGRTRQLADRIAALRSTQAEETTLIGRLPETDVSEKRLHAVFHRHRVRGEWFNPAPEILALAAAGEAIYCAGFTDEILSCFDAEWALIMSYRQ